MKIQIASDLHLEFLRRSHAGYTIVTPAPEAEVLVLAGDIAHDTAALEIFGNWPVPVIYIAGNHEFYGKSLPQVRRDFTARAGAAGAVLYCENSAVQLLDQLGVAVRFLCATLWTDYGLDGKPEVSMAIAGRCMRDHEVIRMGQEWGAPAFLPADALALHQQSRAWLEEQLALPFEGKTVVVTHHCPDPLSVDPQYAGDAANPAFTSDLSKLMGPAHLWLHGHTHSSCDYVVNGTRVVCNPCGYPRNRDTAAIADLVFENAQFQARLVVEV